MKKIVLILYLFATIPCIATEMCARNDTVVIPLDSEVSATGGGNNASESIWWAIFPYGRIYGYSTLLSAAEGGQSNGSYGSITNTDGKMLPLSDELAGRSGLDANGNERKYCWCRIIHPVKSAWVFAAANCANNCAACCYNYTRSYSKVRNAMFMSVGK